MPVPERLLYVLQIMLSFFVIFLCAYFTFEIKPTNNLYFVQHN